MLAVMFESTVWPERAPAGHLLLRCPFGDGRDHTLAITSKRGTVANLGQLAAGESIPVMLPCSPVARR